MNSLLFTKHSQVALCMHLITEYLYNLKVLIFSANGNAASNSSLTIISLLDIKIFKLLK